MIKVPQTGRGAASARRVSESDQAQDLLCPRGAGQYAASASLGKPANSHPIGGDATCPALPWSRDILDRSHAAVSIWEICSTEPRRQRRFESPLWTTGCQFAGAARFLFGQPLHNRAGVDTASCQHCPLQRNNVQAPRSQRSRGSTAGILGVPFG